MKFIRFLSANILVSISILFTMTNQVNLQLERKQRPPARHEQSRMRWHRNCWQMEHENKMTQKTTGHIQMNNIFLPI